MHTFKIRFNTKHNGSKLKWRVVVNDKEFLAENVIMTCKVETSEDFFEELNEVKYSIKCSSGNYYWINKTLYIN